jgi:hypothetical protein
MGQEAECRLRYRGRTVPGKAQLETDYLLFRGEERLKLTLRELTAVRAAAGTLVLEFPGGPAELELGPRAAKWAEKILHPPSRADKLGLKPGASVRLVGTFEPEFRAELRECTVTSRAADLVFLAAAHREELSRVPALVRSLKERGALWVVYPKGTAAIPEGEVIAAGRAAGLKDVKVAAFSKTHTALKFVRPAERAP